MAYVSCAEKRVKCGFEQKKKQKKNTYGLSIKKKCIFAG